MIPKYLYPTASELPRSTHPGRGIAKDLRIPHIAVNDGRGAVPCLAHDVEDACPVPRRLGRKP